MLTKWAWFLNKRAWAWPLIFATWKIPRAKMLYIASNCLEDALENERERQREPNKVFLEFLDIIRRIDQDCDTHSPL